MNIAGIERLQLACRLLEDAGDAPSPAALQSAASELWSAMFDLHTWPTELRTKGVEIQAMLFRYGPIGMTLDQMVESERLQLRREMLLFVRRAAQLHGDGPVAAMPESETVPGSEMVPDGDAMPRSDGQHSTS